MANHSVVYDVHTSLDPQALNAVGLSIFHEWIEFALGGLQLGGKRIIHPTGRYAASLHYRRYGHARVAIIADEKYAPEAKILETGHGAVDLLSKLVSGRSYPMHRQGGLTGPRMFPTLKPGKRMWARVRQASFTGYARVPAGRRGGRANTSMTGPEWTIPSMPAYAPGRIFRDLIQKNYGTQVAAVP